MRAWWVALVLSLVAVWPAAAEPLCNPTVDQVAAMDDLDMRRLPIADKRRVGELCVDYEMLDARSVEIGLTHITHPERPDGPIFVALHDNEQQAFLATVWAVWTFGGRGVAVDFRDRRYLNIPCPPLHAECDPNRVFGRRGFEAYTARFDELFAEHDHIVAIHTNRVLGLFTLETAKSTEVCDVGDVRDDFVLTGGVRGETDLSCEAPEIKQLTDRGLNVAYLLYDPVSDAAAACRQGCDLQAYATRDLGKHYHNMEAQRGNAIVKHRRQLCGVLDPQSELFPCAALGESMEPFQPLLAEPPIPRLKPRGVPIPRLKPQLASPEAQPPA